LLTVKPHFWTVRKASENGKPFSVSVRKSFLNEKMLSNSVKINYPNVRRILQLESRTHLKGNVERKGLMALAHRRTTASSVSIKML
jgi:hypothetical protein